MKVINRIWALLLLPALAACGNKQDPDTPPEPSPAQAKISVMSFNVRSATISETSEERYWSNRKAAVRNMVNEVKPDVMGMQEATTQQRSDLKTLLPDYALFEVPNTGGSKGGNTILMYNTKVLEAVQCKSFYLSSTPDKQSVNGWNEETQYRCTIWAEFRHKASGKTFFVANTHMPLGSEARDNTARVNSANLNVQRMKKAAGDDSVVFIIGDMNCKNSSDGLHNEGLVPYYDWMSSAREKAVKTDSAKSYNAWGTGSGSIIDHIFYRNAIVSQFTTVNGTGYGVTYISDHYPIVAYATLL